MICVYVTMHLFKLILLYLVWMRYLKGDGLLGETELFKDIVLQKKNV